MLWIYVSNYILGLCPEWSSFKTDNTAVTVSNLMSKAEKQLNVIKVTKSFFLFVSDE